MQAGQLVTKALVLEAETGKDSMRQVNSETHAAPMVRGFAAKIAEALRRREKRARAAGQGRDDSGRFVGT